MWDAIRAIASMCGQVVVKEREQLRLDLSRETVRNEEMSQAVLEVATQKAPRKPRPPCKPCKLHKPCRSVCIMLVFRAIPAAVPCIHMPHLHCQTHIHTHIVWTESEGTANIPPACSNVLYAHV